MKKRTGEPWLPADRYGQLLPAFMANLVVRDVERSLAFYRGVLEAFVHYADVDFAALRVGGSELMLHADHTYESHPWHERLVADEPRGLGAELRLFGVDPEAVESRAIACGYRVIAATRTRGHGWREVMVEDPDGYVWAVGVATESDA